MGLEAVLPKEAAEVTELVLRESWWLLAPSLALLALLAPAVLLPLYRDRADAATRARLSLPRRRPLLV